MNGAWWLALPVLLLPLLWHRRRREQGEAAPLASAGFLPPAEPRRRHVWRWRARALLLVRLLLLTLTIGWLADLMLAWRGDAVLIVAGTDPVWAQQQIKAAGFTNADQLTLPRGDIFAWLARHQREWQDDARLLLVGDLPMPALQPRLRNEVIVRSRAKEVAPAVPAIRAPAGAPRQDAASARAAFERDQRLRYPMPPYLTPAQTLAPSTAPASAPASGPLRYLLTLALIALFALERILAHAIRR